MVFASFPPFSRTDPRQRGRPALLLRLWREKRADTAVEFALIGTAFFLFIFGVFVVSVDQFWQMTLDDAVRNAARQVQIGNITTGSQFVTQVCSEFGVAAPYCSNTLQYDVQEGAYFGAITAATLTSNGTLTYSNSANFPNPLVGSSATTTPSPQFLLVQVAYPLPFKVLMVGSTMTENGTPSLLSTVASVMEPGA